MKDTIEGLWMILTLTISSQVGRDGAAAPFLTVGLAVAFLTVGLAVAFLTVDIDDSEVGMFFAVAPPPNHDSCPKK